MILPMDSTHAEAVAKLEANCFSDAWSETALKEELKHPHAICLVWEENGMVGGYLLARCLLGEAELNRIALQPDFRGKGIGSRLLARLIELVRQENGQRIHLEVRTSNQDAIDCYRRMGFEPVGERKGFYSNPAENALLMTVELTTGENK